MEHSSKEYYEKQSEFWFNEASKFVKQRDELIEDLARVREERDKLKAERDNYKDKLDEVIDLFNTHLAYKKAWSNNPYYDKLQNKLNRILEDTNND